MTRLVRIDNTPIVLIAEDDDQGSRCSASTVWGHAAFFVAWTLLCTVVLLLGPGAAR